MNQAIELKNDDLSIIEKTLLMGDLSGLNNDQRISYYKAVCESLGINPLLKPFDYIRLNNKLILYATKSCTDQLRSIHKVSVKIRERANTDGLYTVVAEASDLSGRTDEAIGALSIAGLKGEALANAIMKCETKAKRRATLSFCGLGMLDETEIESAQAAPFKNTQANVVDVVRPTIENSPEREALIVVLEEVKKQQGHDGLSRYWKENLSLDQRKLVGAEEIQRIKNLEEK